MLLDSTFTQVRDELFKNIKYILKTEDQDALRKRMMQPSIQAKPTLKRKVGYNDVTQVAKRHNLNQMEVEE
jgi:hypothetical protein